MFESIVQNTLITTGLFVSSMTSSYAPLSSDTFYPGTKGAYIHVVKEGESFSSIAETYYEDSALWSAIWEDNQLVGGPNSLEPGMQIRVRRKEPEIKQIATTGYVQSESVVQEQPTQAQPELTPTAAPQPIQSGATGPLNDVQIQFLGNCESGMRPDTNTGNGFYGAFQFMIGTWNRMETGYTRADLAPLEVQIAAVQRLLSRSSIWTQFPGCASKMHNAGLI